MRNLAGVKDADCEIRDELAIAKIPAIDVDLNRGEVSYSIIGKIGNWTLTRAWYYWIARVEDPIKGMKLDDAIKLHNKETPNGSLFGFEIRAGGHAGGIDPDDYVAQPVYDDAFLEQCKSIGLTTQFYGVAEFVKANYGEIAELCKEGKLKVDRFVDCYHIDTQLGLCEFSDFIKQLTNETN